MLGSLEQEAKDTKQKGPLAAIFRNIRPGKLLNTKSVAIHNRHCQYPNELLKLLSSVVTMME
jgi:hypothetical protein